MIFVPVNILYRERELSHILSDAEPKLFVTEKELPALRAEAAGKSAELAETPLDGDSPAALVYTSGTTGVSKGAILTHNNFAVNAANLLDAWRITQRTGSCWRCRCFTSMRSATGCTAGSSRDAACACWSASSTKKPRPSFWISVRRCFRRADRLRAPARHAAGDRARNRPGHAPVRIRLGAAAGHRCSKTSANYSATRFSSATG